MFYSVYSSSENLCFSSGPAVSGVVVHSPSLDPDNWLTMTYEEFADKNWEDRLEYEMKMAMECEKNTELEELYRVESQEDTPSGNIDDDSESSVSSLLSPYDAAVSILMDGRFGVLEWSTVDGGSLPKFKEDVELEGDSEEDDMKDRDEYLANVDSGLSDTEVSMHPLYDPDSSVMVDCDCELERLFVMADDVPRDPVVEGWSVGAVAEVEECEEDEDEDRAIEDGWVYLMLDDLIEA